ncbi:MAG: hypothetical protein AAFM92_02805 [Pseudomonadota bacterium]
MSNTDGFIAEVEEELRRDRFSALLRRYGWIAALAVIVLVGGTAWNEYRKAQAEAEAEARGDAINTALTLPDAAARGAALAASDGIVEAFLAASEFQTAGDTAEAVEVLGRVASDPETPALYRDLAQIKRLAIDTDVSGADRALALSALSEPGAPYRTVALELSALDLVAAGETEAAIDAFNAIIQDAEASQVQRRRLSEVVIALGGTPELASALPGASGFVPSE